VPITLRRGTIIKAVLDDHHGKKSEHFAVVLTKTADIQAGSDLSVAGISTSVVDASGATPSHWHFLDTKPGGDPNTGLYETCVVKPDWADVVRQSDVVALTGYAPTRIVKQLIKYVEEHP
jgi:hypothetical protein